MRFLVTCLFLVVALSAMAECNIFGNIKHGFQHFGHDVSHVAHKVGGGVKKGAEVVGHGVKKGAHEVSHGVKKGAHEVSHGVKKGANVVGNGVKKGAGEVAHIAKEVAHDVQHVAVDFGGDVKKAAEEAVKHLPHDIAVAWTKAKPFLETAFTILDDVAGVATPMGEVKTIVGFLKILAMFAL